MIGASIQKGLRIIMKSTRYQINRTIICLAWLFSVLFISQGPLPNFVLCIGADGHIKVEAADRGRCASFPTETEQKTSDFLSTYGLLTHQDHCGSCLDLPIFISSADEQCLTPIQPVMPQSSRAAISASPSQSLCATTTIGNSSSYFPPLINPTLASLRTITLLI